MRPKIIWIVFCKEITEALRDRVTLVVVFLLPLLGYPLLILTVSKLLEHRLPLEEKPPTARIAVWGEAPPALREWLERTNTLVLRQWKQAPDGIRSALENGILSPPATPSPQNTREALLAFGTQDATSNNPVALAARRAISTGEIDAVFVVWPGFAKALETGAVGTVSVFFDAVKKDSMAAADKLEDELRDFRRHTVRERERAHRLHDGSSRAVEILSSDVSSPTRRTGQVLALGIPLLLIVLSSSGALYVAVDITAGEKDRGTMETLLCAPLRSSEIVCGKLLTVWAVALVSSLANLISMGASFSALVASIEFLAIPLSTYVLTFFLLLPVAFTVSALFLAVAVLGRDAKDAGNFVAATLPFVFMPLAIVMIADLSLKHWTACLPLANIMLLIKSVFLGETQLQTAFLTVVSATLYVALVILFAGRVFGREHILLGGSARRSGLFTFERKSGPTPAVGIVAFAIAFVLLFYGSLLVQGRGAVTALLVTQYACLLMPVLLLSLWMKYSARETFSLRRPHWRAGAGAVLIGVSAWAVLATTVTRFMPEPPDVIVEVLKKALLAGDGRNPLWLVWFATAITPAVCEELVFRGFILSALRRFGKWPAILISALLFALLHPSIYQFAPTFLMGVLLGWLVWVSGSVFCSIIVHALSNGVIATLVHFSVLPENFDLGHLPWAWPLAIAGAICLLIGILLARARVAQSRADERRSSSGAAG